jgi:hypothetical protein
VSVSVSASVSMVPWILGNGSSCELLASRCPLPGCRVIDVLDDATAPVFHLVNAANARAYAGMPMPPWVQLDCASLPAGLIGLGRMRDDVDEALVDTLIEGVRATFGDGAAAACAQWRGLIPLAEYTCVQTPEPGHVVGFSLYSLVTGLGLRTKAMALAMHQARVQTGIAQIDNSALRLHVALGPLDVRAAGVAVHTLADRTIVYALAVPPADVLARVAQGGALPSRGGDSAEGAVRMAIGPDATRELRKLLRDRGPHAIVDVTRVDIVLAPRPL